MAIPDTQRLIVRQSSMSNATNFMCKLIDVDVDLKKLDPAELHTMIRSFAAKNEAWVFREDKKVLIEVD